jgi:type IV pilus assembly protein PilQ
MMTIAEKTKTGFASFAILMAAIAIIGGCASRQTPTGDIVEGELPAGPKQITGVTADENAESVFVRVKGNRQLTYTSVKQNLPLGILFYFPQTGIEAAVPEKLTPANEVIDSVEISQLNGQQDMSRMLIALKKDIPYEVTPAGNGIRIAFAKTHTDAQAATPAAAPAEPASADSPAAQRLKGVYVIKSAQGTVIKVRADGAIRNYKAFTLKNPARIVFDLSNLSSPFKGLQTVKVDTRWVRRARHCGYPDKVRLVVDTKNPYLKTYKAVPTAEGLLIEIADKKPSRVSAVPAATPPPEEKPVAAAAPAAEPPVAGPSVTEAPAEKMSPPAPSGATTAWINRIDFRSEEGGKSTLIIGTTRPVRYDLAEPTDTLLKVKLYNTRLPQYRNRPLITTRFESAVNRITPVYRKSKPDTSVVAIELREKVPHDVEQQDDVLLIHFDASSIPPKPLEQADLPSWKKVLAQTDLEPEAPVAAETAAPETTPSKGPQPQQPADVTPAGQDSQVSMPAQIPSEPEPPAETGPMAAAQPLLPDIDLQPGMPSQPTIASTPRRYTGEKIALDFYETDIKNVFRILREISGQNFAIDKDVTGNVTLTLEKPVPWDQVLDLVLKMNGLGMAYEGDIIRIATKSTLQAEEEARKALVDSALKTKFAEQAAEPKITEYIPINYSDAKTEIAPHVEPLLSQERKREDIIIKGGKLSVDQRNNQLIVTDTADVIQQIKEVVNMIDTVTPQVVIEAKVVEVNEEFSTELGIDWDVTWGPISNAFGTAADLLTDVSMNFPSEAASTVGFTFEKLAGTPFLLDATLNAVEANQKGRIITAPKIVTLDNKKAKIKQGVEWPYLERDSSGNATVKFKDIDLLLEVTPTVTPDDRVLLKIFITKNDIGQFTLGVPSLNTNEAQTELLVNDGDTIVIGGIIKSNETDDTVGWPGLMHVPFLGWLFKTNKETDTSRELLIFITPRIVQLEQRRLM